MFTPTPTTPNMPPTFSNNKYYKITRKSLKNMNINSKQNFKNTKKKDMVHFQRKN